MHALSFIPAKRLMISAARAHPAAALAIAALSRECRRDHRAGTRDRSISPHKCIRQVAGKRPLFGIGLRFLRFIVGSVANPRFRHYTLLVHDCRSALETVGLDPCVGFLHRLRPGRPSLALDLMEEFRPHLADRLALTLFNRGELKTRDFRIMENGAVLLERVARNNVLIAYQDRKKDEIEHESLREKPRLASCYMCRRNCWREPCADTLSAYSSTDLDSRSVLHTCTRANTRGIALDKAGLL